MSCFSRVKKKGFPYLCAAYQRIGIVWSLQSACQANINGVNDVLLDFSPMSLPALNVANMRLACMGQIKS